MHPLRTFGNPKSHQFDTIAEIEYGDHFKNYQAGIQTAKPQDVGHIPETTREEAILHTRTTTVSYSK